MEDVIQRQRKLCANELKHRLVDAETYTSRQIEQNHCFFAAVRHFVQKKSKDDARQSDTNRQASPSGERYLISQFSIETGDKDLEDSMYYEAVNDGDNGDGDDAADAYDAADVFDTADFRGGVSIDPSSLA